MRICAGRITAGCNSFVPEQIDWDSYYRAAADLAFWFGFAPDVLEKMSPEEILIWQEQANRQIKEGYRKGC